ncbi:ABC transporter substrate-binding protein [Wukongibacter baidiensis]|uniref:ABC transporter substrate-binding protein n=1 Tax=Wukongibacter baidiensis TaxID=1723361 RepID=UPI003D7F1F35
MLKKSIVLVLVFCLTITLALAGCSKQTDTASQGEEKQVADQISEAGSKDAGDVQKQESDETAPNPAKTRKSSDAFVVGDGGGFKGQFISTYNSTVTDAYVMKLCFSPLLRYNNKGEIEPVVAKSYDVSEDKKTFTFHLRDDVKFSDGTPLTAKDVAFTYNTIADPSYDGRHTAVVQEMVGFKEYNDDEAGKVKTMSGIKIVDEHTISFTFNEALRTNIENFVGQLYIIPEHYYGFEKGKTVDIKAKQHEVVGSGPYKLVNFEPGQFVELAINENYFHENKPKIPKVIIKKTEDATQTEELIAGQIDMIAGEIDPDKLAAAKDSGFVDFYQYPRSGYGYLKFNTQEAPTNDKNVRKALVYGFNRKAFVDAFFKGLAKTQDVPINQVAWGYTKELQEKLISYDYNPEEAGKLLDEAGWKMGDDGFRYKDGKKLSVQIASISDMEMWEMVAGLMADNYKKIGVELKIGMMDFNSLMTKVYDERDGFNMYSMAVTYYTPDPANDLYSAWHSKYDVPGGDNTAQFRNEKNDELLENIRKEFDIEKAKKMYEEWALNINDEMPILILYANLYTDMVNNRVKGYSPTAIYNWSNDIVNMSIEE